MENYPATLGEFEIVRPLAEGGCGQVYLAHLTGAAGFSRTVAIKRIRPEYTTSQSFIDDFIREARIGGFLQHHNVVQVFGFEQVKGNYFLIMEYVDGVGLERVIQMTRKRLEMLPFSVVAEIMAQAADGLQYVHTLHDRTGSNLQLVHRDLKPSNLMISRMGLVKITDFGVARAAINVGVRTQAGLIKGTLAYLSPEQARDEPLDGRSDLYSLGSILYELLTLRRLFTGDSVFTTLEALGNNQVQESLDRLPREAAPFLPLLQQLLTRNPGDRIQSADVVAREARNIQRDLSTPGPTLATFAEQWIRADEANKAARELADSISEHGSLPQTEDWASDRQVSDSITRQSSSLTDVAVPPTKDFSASQSEMQETEALSPTRLHDEYARSPSQETPPPTASSAPDTTTDGRTPEKAGAKGSPSDSATLKLNTNTDAPRAGVRLETPTGTRKGSSRGLYIAIAILVVVLGSVATGLFYGRTSGDGGMGGEPAGRETDIHAGALSGDVGDGNGSQGTRPESDASLVHHEEDTSTVSKPGETTGQEGQEAGNEGQETGNVASQVSSLPPKRTSPLVSSTEKNDKPGTLETSTREKGATQTGASGASGEETSESKNQAAEEGQTNNEKETQQASATTDANAGSRTKPLSGQAGTVTSATKEIQGKGELTLTSMPSAHAFLDGKSVGETPIKKLTLPAGTYEIRLSRPDLGFQQHTQVTVKPGKKVRVICLDTGCDVVYP